MGDIAIGIRRVYTTPLLIIRVVYVCNKWEITKLYPRVEVPWTLNQAEFRVPFLQATLTIKMLHLAGNALNNFTVVYYMFPYNMDV